MSLPRPCIGCGEPIPNGSRCSDCRPKRTTTRRRGHIYDSARWRRTSARWRKTVGQCEMPGCPETDDLVLDHRLPLASFPELAWAPENYSVKCRRHNAQKRDQVTDEEVAAVHAAITARPKRATGQ